MIVLRRANRALYRTWWRALPLTLPMTRAMCPLLVALVPLMIRVGALAAFVTAMLTIIFSTWGLCSQLKRNRLKSGWFPWTP